MPREAVIEAMIQRVAADAPEEARPELLAAAYFLLGVRYPTDDADIILRRLQAVRESSTYKAVLAEGRRDGMREGRESGMREGRESGIREGRELGVLEGRAAEARALLHRLGTAKFGDGPDAATARAVGRIRDIERLEQLLERLLTADSWSELLAKP
jgi:predicted transposase YdaD